MNLPRVVPRIGKFIVEGWFPGVERMESYCLTGAEFQFLLDGKVLEADGGVSCTTI